MTSRHKDIEVIFSNLLADNGADDQRIRQRIDRSAPLPVYAACVFPHKSLLLEIGSIRNTWLPRGFRIPHIKGLNIFLRSQKPNPDSDITLFLELQQEDAIDVFIVFATRICEELDNITKSEAAIKMVLSLIGKWKSFFAGGSDILSRERQIGLYGELYFVWLLSTEGVNIGQAVQAWTGSGRTNQDFEFGTISAEVKSTTAVNATSVKISNSRQLDDTGLESLYLVHILLDVRQGGGQTLPGLIDVIRQEIEKSAPEANTDFEEKLFQAGYYEKDVEQYVHQAYSERNVVFYSVVEGFPRVLERDLAPDVTNISYEIILTNCQKYILSREVILANLSGAP